MYLTEEEEEEKKEEGGETEGGGEGGGGETSDANPTTVYLGAEVVAEFKICFANSFDVCVFHLVQPRQRL